MRRFLLAFCVVSISILMAPPLVAAPGGDVPTTHFFTLTVDGVPMLVAAAQGIGSESEVVEHRVVGPGGEDVVMKIPGRTKYLDLTLKRGLTSNLELWAWRALVESGDITTARKNCSLVMMDQSATPVARWNFHNAWPMKISLETEEGLAVEVLTLAVERMTRVAP